MDDEGSAMDREEYPAAVECEDASTATCTPEGPSVDREPSDEVGPASVQNDATPETPAVVADPDVPTDIEPAQIVEALLFAADSPINAIRLAELSGMGSAKEVREHIQTLNEKYAAAGLSFRIEPIARGYQMLSLPAYRPWLAKLNKHRSQSRLSAAALETLSIIAYKQPVIRADIEAIRGVSCGDMLNRLREMGLIKIMGRAEIVGRPILYGTTRKFLDVFGLADLEDLPPMETLTLRRPEAKPEAQTPDAEPGTPVEASVAAAGA